MKRKIIWLVVSCLMALSLVLASCGPAAPEEKEEEVTPPLAEEEEEEGEEVVFFEAPLSVGETARTSKLAVTVLEATVTDSYEYYSTAEEKTLTKEAKPDMTFLILKVKFENLTSGPTREGLFQMKAYDSEVDRYRPGSYYGEDRMSQDRTIDPGSALYRGPLTGMVLFNIQKGTSDLTFVYNFHKYPEAELLAEWKIQ